MSAHVIRYNRLPKYWPTNTVVFVDFANGLTKQYQTDSKGVPTFINRYYRPASVSSVEEFPSDGTGVVTTTVSYLPGSLRVFVDGSLTAPSRVTETSSTTYTISTPPDIGSLIITYFNPLQ